MSLQKLVVEVDVEEALQEWWGEGEHVLSTRLLVSLLDQEMCPTVDPEEVREMVAKLRHIADRWESVLERKESK